MAIFAVPGVAWLTFCAFYYGALLPNSFYSKRGMSTFFEFVQQVRQTFRWWLANPLGISQLAGRVLQYPASALAVVPLLLRGVPPPIRYALGAYPFLLWQVTA